jgi:hypothetical protein
MSEEKTLNEDEPFWRRPVTIVKSAPVESLREVWAPETVSEKVDEEAPAADEGDCQTMSASQAPSSTDTLRDESDFVHTQRHAPVSPQEALRQAEAAVDVARHELRQARDTVTQSRTGFAKALANYNRAAPVMTAEENTRQWIAGNQAEKARLAGRQTYIPTVTETARAMGGGNHRHGGGKAYRRGVPGNIKAYTQAEAMTLEANRLRLAAAAAAAKPRGQ